MPHPSVTVYDLLLSCPGDVLDLKSTIEDCVNSFNSTIGVINSLRVELKHWTMDSFPESGDKPQNILNKQFVTDCDFCVALLGVRFGTPTDNYDSGTEEEIENMLSQGKQVFLYFVERSVDPSTIDLEQYKNVKEFKEKYAEKGVYSVVKTAEELRKEFQNALTMYLIKLVAPTTQEIQPKLSPNLIISSLSLSDDKDNIVLKHSNLQNVKLVEDKKLAICNYISEINGLVIVPSEKQEEKNTVSTISDDEVGNMKVGEFSKAANKGIITSQQIAKILGKSSPTITIVSIIDSDKDLVQKFCEKYGVSLSENFWNMGNLRKELSSPIFSIYEENAINYIGSDSEKRKHELLSDLVSKIEEFNDIVDYFAQIDQLYHVSLFIGNEGTTFDEDIDVRVLIDKGHIVKPADIPMPGTLFLDEVVKCNAAKVLFAGYRDSDIDDYSNYPTEIPYIPGVLPSYFESASESLKKQQDHYLTQVENIFCYDFRENEHDDILMFNIPYLKQNTKMFFPSNLYFSSIPNGIRFEIRSKHSPKVYKKNVSINE